MTKPVVALDIDGTLGDYHSHFLRFAESWLGRPMPDPQTNTDGVPLFKLMRVSKRTYRDCKLAYRQGGMKRSMPVYDGVPETVRAMRKSGVEVWICTTRPYLRLDNIDPDTRHWLRRNGIQYDGVLFGEHKYRDLLRIVGEERVLFVVDDQPELLRTVRGRVITILRDQPYNRYATEYGARVATMEELSMWFIKLLHEWREKHA